MWLELQKLFSQGSGPKIYNLQKEISNISQNQMTIIEYFTRFKKLRDQLLNLEPLPECTCGAIKTLSASHDKTYAMRASISDPFTSITEVDGLASSSSGNDSFVTPITIQDESIACSNLVPGPIPIQVSSLHSDSSHAAFDSIDFSVPSLPMSIVPTSVTLVPASTSTHEPPSAPI
nr:hypothetical protein CFP56_29498 [Quercus suber]